MPQRVPGGRCMCTYQVASLFCVACISCELSLIVHCASGLHGVHASLSSQENLQRHSFVSGVHPGEIFNHFTCLFLICHWFTYLTSFHSVLCCSVQTQELHWFMWRLYTKWACIKWLLKTFLFGSWDIDKLWKKNSGCFVADRCLYRTTLLPVYRAYQSLYVMY